MSYSVFKMNSIGNDTSFISIDGLIVFDTNEDRSKTVLQKMMSINCLPKQVLIIRDIVPGSFPVALDDSFSDSTEIVTNITTNYYDSIKSTLKDINSYLLNKNAIGIDISVMPTPIFAQILHFILKKHADKKIIVYYTEPAYYSLDELFDFNTLGGEIEIRSIPGYEGKTSQENAIRRVIFYMLGFETNGLYKLIPQEVTPDYIVPINGFPSYFPKYKDISILNNNTNYHEIDIQMAYSSANNPFEAYNVLCELKQQRSQYCIDIIPAGSKPMALGACLFALKEGTNDIRLLFPFPSEIITHQSVGSGTTWEYVIN